LCLDGVRMVSPGACPAARSFIACPENPPADLPDAPSLRNPVKRARQKDSVFQNVESGVWSARLASARGADASSRTRGGMRWTWRCRRASDIAADDEVVWSWRAHAGVKFSRRHAPFEDDGGNKLVHRGEREVSRKALRSEGRSDSACTCGQRAHAQDFSCAWAVGAAGTRPSLRPRQCQRVSRLASLGRIPSRERGGLPSCLKNRIWKSGIVIARCIAPTSPPKRVRREGGSNPECHAVKVGIASLPPSLIELRRTSRSQ